MPIDEARRENERAVAELQAAVDAAEHDARTALADARKVRADLNGSYPEPSAEARARVHARLASVRARQMRVLTEPDLAASDARRARSG